MSYYLRETTKKRDYKKRQNQQEYESASLWNCTLTGKWITMPDKSTLENKFVFQDDTAARYIFFALKNDMGGLGGYEIRYQNHRILSDTYFDRPDFRLSRNGECRRYRRQEDEDTGYIETIKERFLQRDTNTYTYRKTECKKDALPQFIETDGESLQIMGRIRTYRMIFDILLPNRGVMGRMHCDQSASLHSDGSVNRNFYEIELHYDDDAHSLESMRAFSNLLQNTFNLIPIRGPKLERALGMMAHEMAYQGTGIKHLILDTDFTADDSLAVLLALGSPEISLKAITTVGGVSSAKQSALNALRTVHFARKHLRQGFGSPVIARGMEMPSRFPDNAYTNDISEFTRILEPYKRDQEDCLIQKDASQTIENILSASETKATLICSGPLTNLAAWIKNDRVRALISERIAQIVVIGGIFFERGSGTELNISSDPDAADEVVRFSRDRGEAADIPLIFIGLDVTGAIRLRKSLLRQASDPAIRNFLTHIVNMRPEHIHETLSACYLNSSLAVAYLIDPGVCELERFDVKVETRGKWTAGMTLVNRDKLFAETRDERTRVCFKADAGKFESFFKKRIICHGLSKN